ncbi:MAG TPA: hypothetical protein VMM76_26535 [Pirellulaceae bacterium]|nr:hypothetical protein [Pirellulaceae bacterium]
MKRNRRHRPLAFEQFEAKAAPSSILLVLPAGGTDAVFGEVATTFVAANSLQASNFHRYETEQILRFIDENTTGGEETRRTAALPTAVECAASDEMMRQIATASKSLFVLGFYDGRP